MPGQAPGRAERVPDKARGGGGQVPGQAPGVDPPKSRPDPPWKSPRPRPPGNGCEHAAANVGQAARLKQLLGPCGLA